MKAKRFLALMCALLVMTGMMCYADEVTPISETNEKGIYVNGDKIELDYIKNEDSSLMAPVRMICEALGFNVEWVAETNDVIIEKMPLYYTFNINSDGYTVSKTAPIKIGKAPILVDWTTYVPVEFFSDIMSCKVEIIDEILSISIPEEKVVHKVIFNGISENILSVYDLKTGDVLVNLTVDTSIEDDVTTFEKGQILEIVYDDFMTMSLPPITNAIEVKKTEGETAEVVEGTVTSVIKEESINQIVIKDAEGMETALNISADTAFMNLEGEDADIESFTADKKIFAVVSMASTRSLPPQRAAYAVRIAE